MTPYKKARVRDLHRIKSLKLSRVSLCADPANEYAKVALFKSRDGHLADPATSRACASCGHVRTQGLTRCPACNTEEADMSKMNILDRIEALNAETLAIAAKSMSGGGAPKRPALRAVFERIGVVEKADGREVTDADLREMFARDPELRDACDREVSKAFREDRGAYEEYREEATARKTLPTDAESLREAGRARNGRAGEAGKCPKCDAQLVDTHGAYCSICGHQLPVAKGSAFKVDAVKKLDHDAIAKKFRENPAAYAEYVREATAGGSDDAA